MRAFMYASRAGADQLGFGRKSDQTPARNPRADHTTIRANAGSSKRPLSPGAAQMTPRQPFSALDRHLSNRFSVS
jgi:hypothetical protein